MKKRISLFFCVFMITLCVFALGASAAEYKPDSDGTYTVEIDMPAAGEYIMFVLKGEYDQTNYIEAFNAANDSEILYFEQKVSDENGVVKFGPFVPFGYFDSTVILGGTNLDEPYLAGNLSAEGISNTASIELNGIEKSYTVLGNDFDSFDHIVEVEAEVLDSFGFPSLTGEEVTYSLINNKKGVYIDGNVIVISRIAEEQVFIVNAKAGDATKSVYVEVKRNASKPKQILVYGDEQHTESTSLISVYGIDEVYSPIMVYPVTKDQYGDTIADTYLYYYDGKQVDATFVPETGMKALAVRSESGFLEKEITILATRVFYKESALELFNLYREGVGILEAPAIVSVDGKDVLPEETWTTKAAQDAFATALNTANEALKMHGRDGYLDGDYEDELAALVAAKTKYEGSFKAGLRKDLVSVEINEEDFTMLEGAQGVKLTTTTNPRLGQTTDVLTWTSSDESIATVTASTDGKAIVKGISSGKATITVTTRAGISDSVEVTVIKKTLNLLLTVNVSGTTPVATYGSDPVILTAKDDTKGSTDIITWTVANPDILDLSFNEYIDDDGFRIIKATIIPKSAGTTRVTVNALYGEKSAYKNITVKMPDWETAAAPVASVESGSLLPGTAVALTSEPGTTIYYTLDGTTPSKSNGRIYKNPIAISKSLTIKAIAVGEQLFDSEVAVYEYKVVASSVKASNAVARRGDYVDVTVSAEDFDAVKNAVINVAFDNDVLELAEVDYVCDYVDADNSSYDETGVKIALGNDDGFSYSGVVAVITFRVRDEATEGASVVSVTASAIQKVDGTTYDAASFDGEVVINNYIVGDANNDGKIGLADVLLLKQYLAGKESAVNSILLGAADTDGDGDIDNDDVTLLSKYCVGYNVTLG